MVSKIEERQVKRFSIVGHWSIWLAFFIWPFGTFVASLRFIGKRVFSAILVLLYFMYGYTYIIIGKDQDTYRTAQYFAEAGNWSIDDFWSKIANLYVLGNKPDVFQDVLQFVVSQFTSDFHIYFAIAASLFGFVTARILENLFKDANNKEERFLILLFSLFLLLVLAPSKINSFRHYMAMAIFVLAAYRYLTTGGFLNLILLCITPFVHFAFIAVIPLIIIFKLIGRRYFVYYVLIICSFLFAKQGEDYIKEYIPTLDESSLQYHAKQYTSDYYLEKVAELKVQRVFILDRYVYYTTIFFLLITLYHARFLGNMDEGTCNMFALSLLIFAFVNFFSELESIANRFGVLYQGFCCAFLIRFYLQSSLKAPRLLKGLFIVVLLVNAVIVLRILIQSASVSNLLLFFPLALFSQLEVSILDLIK